MFRPFWDESSLGFFDQEIILNFHFPTSCIFRLRGVLISITNHQIRETRWLAKPYVWFNLRKVLLKVAPLRCSNPTSKLHAIQNRKHIFMITQENDGILLQVARTEEESLEATVAILYSRLVYHLRIHKTRFFLLPLWIEPFI